MTRRTLSGNSLTVNDFCCRKMRCYFRHKRRRCVRAVDGQVAAAEGLLPGQDQDTGQHGLRHEADGSAAFRAGSHCGAAGEALSYIPHITYSHLLPGVGWCRSLLYYFVARSKLLLLDSLI